MLRFGLQGRRVSILTVPIIDFIISTTNANELIIEKSYIIIYFAFLSSGDPFSDLKSVEKRSLRVIVIIIFEQI